MIGGPVIGAPVIGASVVGARWSLVIPVKGTAMAKSRFGAAPEIRSALALAMALDTVSAALAAQLVSDVFVITSAAVGPTFSALGATVVPDPGAGLNAAIVAGLTAAVAAEGGATNLAIMLGDLPALRPAQLDAALALAFLQPLSMVPDAAETGTTLLTALAGGGEHVPAFGGGSATAHHSSGYVPLAIPASSGLRTDVDTLDDLSALLKAPAPFVGPHTRAVLDSLVPSIFV